MLHVAHIVPRTEAEGPGLRTAIWVRGCAIRCPGCCNPELFGAARPGSPATSVPDVLAAVPEDVEGITLLGGEPLDQPDGAWALCAGARGRGLSVVLYSGYPRQEVERRSPGLLDLVDVLVDGPYDAARPESAAARPRRWVGSTNQGLHFLTPRYSRADFDGRNTVELRLDRHGVLVNGWPQAGTLRGLR